MSERQAPFQQARSGPKPGPASQPALGKGQLKNGGSEDGGAIDAGAQGNGWPPPPRPGQPEWLSAAIEEVPVASLVVSGTPRLSGEDLEHVQTLAAAASRLPPIIVHRQTMRVIDGMHRIRVARLKGQERITVRFFNGSEEDAFILAVKANITHGLPLPLADRKAAVARIIESHPQWADRMIAQVTGLAARTVAEIRKESTAESRPDARLGRDGRLRPVNGSAGRLVASELITSNPHLSLRQIARQAGISPETARDVRNRLRKGESPVPARPGARRRGSRERPSGEETAARPRARAGGSPEASRIYTENRLAVLERLRTDPALRFTDKGRSLLRLLHIHAMRDEELNAIAESVPAHCRSTVAYLARECARLWEDLADRVEQKGRHRAEAAAGRSPQ
jgi:ParB-like chromosome segregation protein Spo0J